MLCCGAPRSQSTGRALGSALPPALPTAHAASAVCKLALLPTVLVPRVLLQQVVVGHLFSSPPSKRSHLPPVPCLTAPAVCKLAFLPTVVVPRLLLQRSSLVPISPFQPVDGLVCPQCAVCSPCPEHTPHSDVRRLLSSFVVLQLTSQGWPAPSAPLFSPSPKLFPRSDL